MAAGAVCDVGARRGSARGRGAARAARSGAERSGGDNDSDNDNGGDKRGVPGWQQPGGANTHPNTPPPSSRHSPKEKKEEI